jgi:hypothetical protein
MNEDQREASAATQTNAPRTVTTAEVLSAMRKIDLLPRQKEWMLVAPDGRIWKADPEKLLQVLMPYHPLLKPMSLGEMFKEI